MSETMHACCVAIGGRGVLLAGRSGSGKSDLALRLIDRGATLVADDYTLLEPRDGRLWASAPPAIAGRIEVRGVGIVAMAHAPAPAVLLIDCVPAPERMPEPAMQTVAGIALPHAAVAALEPAAPIKVELLLKALA